ncbi:hypothetical protein [Erythrobacter sp. R86502]|uniref:head-tail connector protein n=1 Tax=Erythrobacter sp. R86502 TaxID=3093846 RepID=UPI0036D23109
MLRTIVQAPTPGEPALVELKHWLGINRPNEDETLGQILQASVTICEAFTGKAPLRQTVEEIIPLSGSWHELISRPVHQLTGAALLSPDGSREVIEVPADALEWRLGSSGCIRLRRPLIGDNLAVHLVVGIAADWTGLPAPLRHGIIRLAAYNFRDREGQSHGLPPASVTALWRPWRDVRLG